jgi:Zn-dependent peptidase ImmA (M78 family)
MKVLLTSLLLFLSIAMTSQRLVMAQPTTAYEQAIIKRVAREYIPADVTIHYIESSPIYPGYNGLTQQLEPKRYLIQMNPRDKDPISRAYTLLHELGHVIDAVQGRLEFNPLRWDGKIYKPMQWQDRPWEQSANEWADCLMYELFVEPLAKANK